MHQSMKYHEILDVWFGLHLYTSSLLYEELGQEDVPLQEDQCKYPSSEKIGQNPMKAQCTNVSVDTHNAICTVHAYIQPTYLDLAYGV